MNIQCECGKFQAELTNFPKNSPGHLGCYCDDCQTYLHYLGRADLLDQAGGTAIIPVYPSEIKITQGQEFLKCTRLGPKGMFRFSTSCCNTPVGNCRPGFPWVGLVHRVFTVRDPDYLRKTLGPIKSAIYGQYAKGTPVEGTSSKLTFKDFKAVAPFLLKGFLFGKAKPSPFFLNGSNTPVVEPKMLSLNERNSIRQKLGFAPA